MSNKEFKNQLQERLINFAVMAIHVVEKLPDNKIGNHLGGQFLRSSTSPALNYGEALAAESRRDFVHKMGITLKELRESYNCLTILSRISYVQKENTALTECNELVAIFVKSITMVKENNAKPSF